LAIELLDTAFLLARIISSVILAISAVVALRVISLYRGGMLQRPWLLLFVGILVFAFSQPISAASAILESFLLRVIGAVLSLASSLSILGGLVAIVKAWKNFRIPES
jgi:hypothetical protein